MATKEQDVVNRMYEALNAHDRDALGPFYSEDCEVVAPPGELRGRDGVQAIVDTYWNAFPDLKWRTVGQYASGDTVVTEEILDGTHDGPLVMPDGSIPASGRHLTTRVCEVARVEGDEIVSLHLYWDNVAFLRAVGAVESPVD
jgi:steroid delta-isomerase-like uncharacterized protein